MRIHIISNATSKDYAAALETQAKKEGLTITDKLEAADLVVLIELGASEAQDVVERSYVPVILCAFEEPGFQRTQELCHACVHWIVVLTKDPARDLAAILEAKAKKW